MPGGGVEAHAPVTDKKISDFPHKTT